MPIEPDHARFRNTPLWRALARAVADLEASREVALSTAPEYVITYLCQELTAKGLVDAAALRHDE